MLTDKINMLEANIDYVNKNKLLELKNIGILEKTKQMEIDKSIKFEEEKIKQLEIYAKVKLEVEKTKQLELQIELLKLKKMYVIE